MTDFMQQVRNLPPVYPSDSWNVHRENLRNSLLDHQNWDEFKQWSTVSATMYTGDPRLSGPLLEYVKGTRWEKELEGYDPKNGTAIDQAYNLALYENVTGRQLGEDDRFMEFGGGYGEMARLIYGAFNPSWYMVYDFPEMGVLQRWYWKKHIGYCGGPPWSESRMINTEGSVPTILISLCGISETSMDVREEFLEGFSADSVLLRFQDGWEGIDNEKFFEEFAEKNYRNTHSSRAPNHIGHRCIIAWGLK